MGAISSDELNIKLNEHIAKMTLSGNNLKTSRRCRYCKQKAVARCEGIAVCKTHKEQWEDGQKKWAQKIYLTIRRKA